MTDISEKEKKLLQILKAVWNRINIEGRKLLKPVRTSGNQAKGKDGGISILNDLQWPWTFVRCSGETWVMLKVHRSEGQQGFLLRNKSAQRRICGQSRLYTLWSIFFKKLFIPHFFKSISYNFFVQWAWPGMLEIARSREVKARCIFLYLSTAFLSRARFCLVLT